VCLHELKLHINGHFATEWEREFGQKEQDLNIMSTETHQLISTMTSLLIDIQTAARKLRTCGTA
jgi:hypothetical protein